MVWVLTDETGELLDRRNSESANVEVSLQELKESFEGVTGDYVEIRVQPKKAVSGGDQKSNLFKFKVKCLTSAAPVQTFTESRELPALKGDAGIYSILTELKVQLAEQKKDVEINELKRQLHEKNKGDGKSRMLERLLTQMLLPELSKTTESAAAIAGTVEEKKPAAPVHTAEQINEAKAQQQRLVQALNKLRAVDGDFITTIEKLQKFAESNAEAYNQYKNML